MNTLFLVATGIVLLLMSQRFWRRVLAATAFRPLSGDYAGGGGATNRSFDAVRAGHDIAASGGVLAMFGAGLAMIWGWAPVYVWLLVGCAVLSGLLKSALAWTVSATPGRHGLETARAVAGPIAEYTMRLTLVGVLLVWTPLLVATAAALLLRHPEAVLVLVLQALVALPIMLRAGRRSGAALVMTLTAGALLALPAGIWSTRWLDLPAISRESPGARIIVAVAAGLVALALLSASRGRTRLVPCFGAVVTAGAALTGVAILLALVFEHPAAGYLAYHRPGDGPGAMPLLLACAAIGIVPLLGESDDHPARSSEPASFAGVAGEGVAMLAILGALLAAPELLPGTPVALPDWQGGIFPSSVAGYLVDAFAALGAALPIPPAERAIAVAAVLAGLTAATMIGGLAALRGQLRSLAGPRIGSRGSVDIVLSAVVTALAALILLENRLGTGWWLAAGQLALLFAAAVLLVAGFAAIRLKRGAGTSLLPGASLLAVFWWTTVAQGAGAAAHGQWLSLTVQLTLAALGAAFSLTMASNYVELMRKRRVHE